MSKRKTVCFTGMESAEQERLTAMFAEANRRLGNTWSLAPENDAEMLIIDVDSLYGHMSWLKVHNSGRTVVALSFYGECSGEEVAEELGTTPGNVRVIRHRVLAQLQACMGLDLEAA